MKSKNPALRRPSDDSRRWTNPHKGPTSQTAPEDAELCLILVPNGTVTYSPRSVLSQRAAQDWQECFRGAAKGYAVAVPKFSQRWRLEGAVNHHSFHGVLYYGDREALLLAAQASQTGGARAWRQTFTDLDVQPPIERPAAPWLVVQAVSHGASHSLPVMMQLAGLPERLGWAWVAWVRGRSEDDYTADAVELVVESFGSDIDIKVTTRL